MVQSNVKYYMSILDTGATCDKLVAMVAAIGYGVILIIEEVEDMDSKAFYRKVAELKLKYSIHEVLIHN